MGIKEKILEDDNELQKYIILLVYANNEPIKDRIKFQKMMFLLADKIEQIKEQSNYEAESYGPYSEIIDEESKYLEQVGLLFNGPKEIAITEKGKEIAQELVKNENKNNLRMIKEYKEFLNDLNSKELLAYVYLAFPSMTEESLEHENFIPHMEEHLLSLVKKHKISAQRAAELLNKSQNYIIKKMKEKGMIVFR